MQNRGLAINFESEQTSTHFVSKLITKIVHVYRVTRRFVQRLLLREVYAFSNSGVNSLQQNELSPREVVVVNRQGGSTSAILGQFQQLDAEGPMAFVADEQGQERPLPRLRLQPRRSRRYQETHEMAIRRDHRQFIPVAFLVQLQGAIDVLEKALALTLALNRMDMPDENLILQDGMVCLCMALNGSLSELVHRQGYSSYSTLDTWAERTSIRNTIENYLRNRPHRGRFIGELSQAQVRPALSLSLPSSSFFSVPRPLASVSQKTRNQERLDAVKFPSELIPEEFNCAIVQEVMDNPVRLPNMPDTNKCICDGASILKALKDKPNQNPFNRQPIVTPAEYTQDPTLEPTRKMLPQLELREKIRDYVDQVVEGVGQRQAELGDEAKLSEADYRAIHDAVMSRLAASETTSSSSSMRPSK